MARVSDGSASGLYLCNPTSIHQPAGQYSHAALVSSGSETLYVAGQVGVNRTGILVDGFEPQVRQAFENLLAVLAAHDMTPANLARVNYYLISPEQVGDLRRIRVDYLPDPPPASTALIVCLMNPNWLFEIDAVAVKALA